MARVNYGFEKRQKEIAKQKKKEAKLKKKLERKNVREDPEAAQAPEEETGTGTVDEEA